MRFEGKELGRAVRYIESRSLVIGTTYFQVRYLEHDLIVPELVPLVFIGRDLDDGDIGYLYFQDFSSFEEGTRFDTSSAESPAIFERFLESQGTSVSEFDDALDELMRCALRRRESAT